MKLHYIGLLLLLVFFMPASADWQNIGPEGGKIKFVCVSPTNDNIVYIATETDPVHVWRSSDGGQTWTKKGEPYNISMYLYDMVISAGDVLYIGTWWACHKSTDQGQTWTHATIQGGLQAIAPHPTNPLIVYGTGCAVRSSNYDFVFFKSTDGGATWDTTEILPGTNNGGYCVTLDPNNPDIIYVGGHWQGGVESKMYKSTNGGASGSWTELSITGSGALFRSVKVHPTNSNIVYAGSRGDGLWRSTNAGGSWTKISTFGNNLILATTPVYPDLVFSTSKDSIIRSTDAGITWTGLGRTNGLNWGDYYGLAISSSNANKVFTGSQSGFRRSTNMGINWTLSITDLRAVDIRDVAVLPGMPSKMYVDFSLECIYETTNGGSTWTALPYFPSVCGTMCAWAINPNNTNIRYAFEGEG